MHLFTLNFNPWVNMCKDRISLHILLGNHLAKYDGEISLHKIYAISSIDEDHDLQLITQCKDYSENDRL